MNTEMIRRAHRALGDPTRLQIVEFLSGMCCSQAVLNEVGGVVSPTAGEVCCHVTGVTKINSTISQHLHELAEANLISLERRGKFTRCALRPETLRDLAGALLELADGVSSGEKTRCL